ncbi:LysM peptidoglycan-binding domain-containing protein [Thiotrichales bacterium 19S3-7]|nr:LysM peptidoglycan-binding domain-containing protein [Thiotrichales bacterium 19S3-7]MCF6801572.1 LysM peptidoglycan-binding domain-containing protein [Thiotrichales bacterium 19S3-11]
MALKWLLRCFSLLSIGLLTACSSMVNFFDAPREGQAAEVTSLGKMPKYYIVKKGDTLPSISREYGISERAIILWNDLKSPYRVEVGQKLQFFSPKSLADKDVNDIENNRNDVNSASVDDDSKMAQSQLDDNQDALIQADTPIVKSQNKPSKTIKNTENSQDDLTETKPQIEVSAADTKDTKKDENLTSQSSKALKTAQSNYYIVQRGDTLTAIARDFNLTLAQVAMINQIKPPYNIYIGEKLLVNSDLYVAKVDKPNQTNEQASASVAEVALQSLDKSKPSNKPQVINQPPKPDTVVQKQKSKPESVVLKANDKATSQAPIANNSVEYAGIQWQLPLKGKITSNDTIWLVNAKAGDSVRSAAKGNVIYAGVGINGYGYMVIIDHGNEYLSAYGNLASSSVKEGQSVSQGQIVGQLGKFNGESQLDFEIRYKGDLISPNKVFNET